MITNHKKKLVVAAIVGLLALTGYLMPETRDVCLRTITGLLSGLLM